MPSPSSDWMNEEKTRAEEALQTGALPNSSAPQLVRVTAAAAAPPRIRRSVYLQDKHNRVFEELLFQQKRATGKKGPALLEEALELLFEKYDVDFDGNG